MDILHSLMAVGAVLLAYLVYVVVSNNIVITALLVCTITFIVLLRRRPGVSPELVLQSQAYQERVSLSQPENLKPIRLNLLVEKSSGKVLLAECDKNFVDVLLSFLVLPLGQVIRLADKESRIGSMDELYKSVEALSTECFWTRACKNMLLEPRSAYGLECSNSAVKIDQTDYNEYYTCPRTPCLSTALGRHGFVSLVENSICGCGRAMDIRLHLDADRSVVTAGGFVTRVERFIVSDDLQVTPVEIDDARSLLQRQGIIKNNEVFVKNVNIGVQEVLQLLHHSVLSKTTLTDVFQPNATTMDNSRSHNSLPAYYQYWTGYHFGPRVMYVNLWFSLSAQKVVCVEAREDFIDFLFSFLTLPLGSIIKLLPGSSSSLGSIDNLYRSVTVLNARGNVSWQNALMLLNPKLERMFSCENQLLDVEENVTSPWFVNANHNSLQIVNPKITGAFPARRGGGFVRQQGCFLVTDSLLVEPLSVVAGIQRLDQPFPDLKKLPILVGKLEALALLEAALTSETVLTRAFWPKVLSAYCLYYG